MGSKGQTTTTSQNQTYTPTGAGDIQSALQKAQGAASLPFNIPQAPVAGFSQDQLSAFQNVNNAQGMAQPYINQANNYFQQSAQRPDVQSYYNPMAANVTSQLQNIFGQQNSQNTGQLTQAAGGVGADRIAVGQANLANQQGLAAGQTYAGLWQQAQQAAAQQQSAQQSAGYGTAALGSQAQNAALQGAQAQLGTGGLQQQLSQAQLNSPYQQQLAAAAFPYQQAQFLAGITGSLAPGLGGTTQGTGSQTSPGPSIWSQILGIGTAGAGLLGASGAFNGGSGYQNSTGNYMGLSNSGQDFLQDSGFPLPSARGGAINPFAEGGAAGDEPIDVAPQTIIPDVKSPAIQPHIPQLNLTPQQPSGGGSGGGLGDVMKLAMAFMKRGGSVNPFAGGGDVGDDHPQGFDILRKAMNERLGGAGAPSTALRERGTNMLADQMNDAGYDTINGPNDPFQLDPQATNAWRQGADAGASETGVTRSLAPATATSPLPPATTIAPAPGDHPAAAASAEAPPASAAPAEAADTGKGGNDFIKSPWAALMAAGLGIAGGTSPFAGVNIGQGGLQGLKMLEQQRTEGQKDETIAQAARRLELEAKHHEDQYSRATPYQQFEMNKPVPMGQRIDPLTGQTVTTYGKVQPDGSLKPVDPTAAATNPAAAAADDAALPANAKATQGFLIPGKNVPDNVDPSVLAGQDPGVANMVRAIDEGRMPLTQVPLKQRYMVERLLHAYDGQWDGTVWGLRNKQQADLATNGTAGKMLTAVNQLLPHLQTAYDTATELANTNYPEANTIKNWWLTATGDSRVKKFQTVREVASMDAARLLRGSGQMSEKDIDEWRKNIAESGSPSQLHDVIRLLASDLIGARISSIQHEYRQNMRQEPPEFLSPEAKTALTKIIIQKNGEKGSGQPAAAAPAGGGDQPPVPGARKAPDNHWYVTDPNRPGKYLKVD